jgi:hypothetical protein
MPSIIEEIRIHPAPYELADWWAREMDANPRGWSSPLEQDEITYTKIFSLSDFEPEEQIRTMVDPTRLTDDEKDEAKEKFGDDPTAAYKYANQKNRLHIIQHYVWHSPAITNYAMALYRLTRDTNPMSYALERGWQIGHGKEMFTNDTVSRARAAAELVVPMLIGAGLSRILKGIAPTSPTLVKVRTLNDPIYDLPAEGSGLRINGRWYTEHALERMAPDTFQIRAELERRVLQRLKKLGVKPGTTAFQKIFDRQMKKVDPRGVPPSVVEAEIMKPGSTNVKVITAKRGSIVVTVIHR